MKTIKVQFDSMDQAENAIAALKENFTFSYSFIDTNLKNTDFNDYINPVAYNPANLPLFYSSLNIIPYPSISNLENESPFERNKVIVHIKCSLSESEHMIGRIWNLGAESAKEI